MPDHYNLIVRPDLSIDLAKALAPDDVRELEAAK
jgi:hypothetical protein